MVSAAAIDGTRFAGFERFSFAGTTIGAMAARTVSQAGQGRVLAVFERCFYVDLGVGLLCVGAEDFSAGPLNVVTTAPASVNWSARGLRAGDRVRVSADGLRVGQRFHITFAGAVEWRPGLFDGELRAEDLRVGLARFRHACAGMIPAEGLGALIGEDGGLAPDSRIVATARAAVLGLEEWFARVFTGPKRGALEPPSDVQRLTGLGPGLTPSGDDVIGGMMIAAHVLGEASAAGQLWQYLRPITASSTGPIARAHLAAAAEGMGAPALHRAIGAMIDGMPKDPRRILAGIDGVGHTSGWDAMVGVTRCMDAWLSARERGARVI